MHTRRSGFTLIELLVVIAIIAILAAILFPVFARAREKARQTSCLSNLKQLALGVLMYAEDYDQRLPDYWRYQGAPGVTYPDGSVNRNATWMVLIYPYVKNEQIFNCPSGTVKWNGSYQTATSYGYNRALMHYSPLMIAFRLRDVANPESHLMIGDSEGPISFWLRDTIPTTSGGPDGWARARHNDGGNFAFVDGHSKWAKFDEEANLASLQNNIPGHSPWWRQRP